MATPLHTLSATELRAALEGGQTTSEAIVEALIARADATELKVAGFTTRLHDLALASARERDRERREGAVRGALHGLPFTVKENIDVAGAPSSVGLRQSLVARAPRDAVIVALARDAGGLCLGKSNIPQALLSMRCNNALYGETKNPVSAAHVTGGSSSGEAALIACGASPMGFGSDLGGSIRFPASFCGVAGFKPTQDAWSNRGANTAIRGQEFVRAQLGPLARTVADLRLLWDALPPARHHQLDHRVPPLGPSAPLARPVRVGVFEDDGVTPPNPAIRRAVREAARDLVAAGVTLVPFSPVARAELVSLYLAAISADGMKTLAARFGDERAEPSTRLMWTLGAAPSGLRAVAARALHRMGERRLASIVGAAGRKPVAAYFALAHRREELRAEMEAAWRAADIAAVICPASASPAVPVGEEGDAALIFSHYCPYNIFGMPAGVVPTTRVRADETRVPRGREQIHKRLSSIAAQSEGLPVAVQVAAPRYADARVLGLMQLLEDAACARDSGSRAPVDP